MKSIFLSLSLLLSVPAFTQIVSGVVRNDEGEPLPNASILIKGKTYGTACNNEGRYFIRLDPGKYTLVCRYVEYKQVEKEILVGSQDVNLDFVLFPIDFELEEVVVRSGQNPGNSIIRNAIEKRPFYEHELDNYRCEVYSKGVLHLRGAPKKMLGQQLDIDAGDTSKNKIIYLSETMATYSAEKPNRTKIVVHSSRVSGDGNSYGLSAPQFYSVYDNNVRIGTNLNPRGFISPISDNAFNYYKFKYVGAFFEDGRQINKIEVTPKRKYEPLFTGFINIIEHEWRIHSLSLKLVRNSGLEYLDTLQLDQIYAPLNDSVWVVQNQVLRPSIKFLGIDAYGSFSNVYTNFELNPEFGRNYFDNTVLKYLENSNRKTSSFWDESRPVQLMADEVRDYRRKDSLEQVSKNPIYLDSVTRSNNRISFWKMFLAGQTFENKKKNATFDLPSLWELISFNIVEGWYGNLGGTWTKRMDTTGRRELRISPFLRYGTSNHHFNASVDTRYVFGKKYAQSIDFGFGKKVLQFNNESRIGPRKNMIASLIGRNNLQKLYEAWYVKGSFTKGIGDGFTWGAGLEYQARMPLENTTDYSILKSTKHDFTPNYPQDLTTENIKKHQALSFNFGLTWQPDARYIEFPDQKINIGSKWPIFSVGYTRTFEQLFGSDVDYSRWRLTITDILSLKLKGLLNYRLGAGGFIGNQHVEIPDYQHFNGNISRLAAPYLNSFQLLPIYEFSNTSHLYLLGHLEYHLNGFITNKLPLFRQLNWFLVTGANAFHYSNNDYYETFIGLENILKMFRIDYYWANLNGKRFDANFRVGVTGDIFGGSRNR